MQDGTDLTPIATAGDAVAALQAAVDGLLEAGLTPLSGVEVTTLLADVERERRRLEAVDQRLLAETADRNVAGEYAASSTAALLVTLLRIAPAQARARLNRARDMGPRHTVAGQPLEPLFPRVAAAQQDGTLSAAYADVITGCLERIPAAVAAELVPVVEQALVIAATHTDPRQLARDAERLLARIDQDGPAPRDREQHRDLSMHTRADGTVRVTGELTAAAGAAFTTVIDALSAPTPASTDGTVPPDPRTPGQRRHDGLHDAMLRLLRAGTLPDSGGVPVTILTTITLDELTQQIGTAPNGTARTAHGDLLPIRDLFRMACDAELYTTIFNSTGDITSEVLAFGRTRRRASPGQRLAQAARDGGCSFPGCDRPPNWCESHHVIPWLLGGLTDLDNLTLLCPYHHRSFERNGWTCRMSNGVPYWTPPAWLDPNQTPIRNTAHHRPDIHFDLTADDIDQINTDWINKFNVDSPNTKQPQEQGVP